MDGLFCRVGVVADLLSVFSDGEWVDGDGGLYVDLVGWQGLYVEVCSCYFYAVHIVFECC